MIRNIIDMLKKEYPEAQCSLDYKNPLQLLIATILAAQCTDSRVNIVTKDLFIRYKTTEDFAYADIHELENYIRSTGFYHNKAKNIIECCKQLVSNYNGQIPKSMDELVALPGVGRKIANVVLQDAYGIIEGIVVDTHCKRLSNRMGLTQNDDPKKIEQDLIKIISKEDWQTFGHLMVFHGRAVCDAKKPKCGKCPINKECAKVGVKVNI